MRLHRNWRLPNVALIVLPENISRVAPNGEATRKRNSQPLRPMCMRLSSRDSTHTSTMRNAMSHGPSFPAPPPPSPTRSAGSCLFSNPSVYTPGPGPRVLANGIGLEICKDMDFEKMLRADEAATKPLLLAVPAWDFDADDWSHARVAILRSVESGVPMARNARDGLLTLNDRYGRLVAKARTVGAFTTVIGELPLDGRGGGTLYDKLGDAFGWLCLALGVGAVGLSYIVLRKSRATTHL